jgi:hypothetical protein
MATVALGVATLGPAWAQETSNFPDERYAPLQGLMNVYPIVILKTEHDKTALPCDIKSEVITDAFMYLASSAKFRVIKDAEVKEAVNRMGPTIDPERDAVINSGNFIVTVMTAPEGAICFSTVDAYVETPQEVKLVFSNITTLVRILLWQSAAWTVRSSTSEHARQVGQTVEAITRKFITTWNEDNRPAEQH